MTKEPTERDYQRYVGDSFKAFNDRIKKLEEVVYLLRNDYMTHKKDIRELEKMVKDLDSRLVYLEEQERSRARADHQREEHLDFENAEGLSKV